MSLETAWLALLIYVLLGSTCIIPRGLSPPARVGSNPDHTDVTVWESLSVYLRKVGGLSSNTLYNVSGFSLS
jgi:hypothetical protein